jgi:hypothetical protein
MRRALVLALLVSGLVLVSWPRSASAQVSIWLQKGVSGVGGSLVFNHNGDQNTYGVNAGYSLRGFVDFDLTIGYFTLDDDNLPPDTDGAVIIPRAEIHPLKQGPGMPVSVGVGAGIAAFALSSDEFDARNIEVQEYNINADVSVYRFFKLAPNMGITPAAEVTYVHQWATVRQFGNELDSSSVDRVGFAVATYMAFLDSAGRIWGVAPNVGFNKDGVNFGLSAGIVLTL